MADGRKSLSSLASEPKCNGSYLQTVAIKAIGHHLKFDQFLRRTVANVMTKYGSQNSTCHYGRRGRRSCAEWMT